MSKEIRHVIVLALTIAASVFVTRSSFHHLNVQISAGIFVVYFVIKKLMPGKSRLFDAVVSTYVVSSVVNATGAIASPFFFLNYFLIFSLSLLLEPIISITTTITLVMMYLWISPSNIPMMDLLPLFSLPFLTPFALVLGEEYRLLVKQNAWIHVIKNHVDELQNLTQRFKGDHELKQIKKTVDTMEKLIDTYEKTTS